MSQSITDRIIAIHGAVAALQEGVSGINKRLDRLNGAVARHEKQLSEREGAIRMRRYLFTIWLAGAGVLGALIAAVVSGWTR